jgi:hypothetical protein
LKCVQLKTADKQYFRILLSNLLEALQWIWTFKTFQMTRREGVREGESVGRGGRGRGGGRGKGERRRESENVRVESGDNQ